MPIGSVVRRVLGPLEPAAISVYREAFIDLRSLATTLGSLAPDTKRILEVGCGDGVMAAELRRSLPNAAIVGIDPGMADPGRMFVGDRTGVEFRRVSTSELIDEQPELFDLVVICDVLHHVADDAREQVLRDAAVLTAPGGLVAVKEWERGPGWWPAYVADRWVSGDATVRFMARAELDGMIGRAMPGWPVVCEARVPPRRANLLLALRRP